MNLVSFLSTMTTLNNIQTGHNKFWYVIRSLVFWEDEKFNIKLLSKYELICWKLNIELRDKHVELKRNRFIIIGS